MFRVRTLLLCICGLLCGDLVQSQLQGGLLGILTPQGSNISLPGILGITDTRPKPQPQQESTPRPVPTPPPTQPPVQSHKPTKRPTTPKPPCNFTPTVVNGKRSCQGKLIFQENFAKLVDRKWTIENRFATEPDYEFTLYENNPDNILVERNRLYIKPSLTEEKYGTGYVTNAEGINLGDSCTGEPASIECVQKPRAWQILPPAISSKISTRNHFNFLYGIVEIKAKLPKGDWIYPELYLRPKSEFYGSGYNSGAIKIAFVPGNSANNRQLLGGVLLGSSTNGRTYGVKNIQSDINWTDDFHTFVVEWTPDRITVSVDGNVYGSITPPQGGFVAEQELLELEPEVANSWKRGSPLAPFDKEMYLSIGVGVGGQCFLDKDFPNKPWSNDDPKAQLKFYRSQDTWSRTWSQRSQLIVDYVKVWAL